MQTLWRGNSARSTLVQRMLPPLLPARLTDRLPILAAALFALTAVLLISDRQAQAHTSVWSATLKVDMYSLDAYTPIKNGKISGCIDIHQYGMAACDARVDGKLNLTPNWFEYGGTKYTVVALFALQDPESGTENLRLRFSTAASEAKTALSALTLNLVTRSVDEYDESCSGLRAGTLPTSTTFPIAAAALSPVPGATPESEDNSIKWGSIPRWCYGAEVEVSLTIPDPDDEPPDEEPPDEPPTVSVAADPKEVSHGGTVSLQATASDPGGGRLTYAWSAPKGKFSGATDGPNAFWRAPSDLGIVRIRVTVSNGGGAKRHRPMSTSRSRTIRRRSARHAMRLRCRRTLTAAARPTQWATCARVTLTATP